MFLPFSKNLLKNREKKNWKKTTFYDRTTNENPPIRNFFLFPLCINNVQDNVKRCALGERRSKMMMLITPANSSTYLQNVSYTHARRIHDLQVGVCGVNERDRKQKSNVDRFVFYTFTHMHSNYFFLSIKIWWMNLCGVNKILVKVGDPLS